MASRREALSGGFLALASSVILILLVHAQIPGGWAYPLLAVAGLALLLTGLARRAPVFAACSLLPALAGPVLFEWDWMRAALPDHGFLALVLPAFAAGLGLALWERLALARWHDLLVPGAADLDLFARPWVWQHLILAVITLFGITVAATSELFGLTVLSAGWTIVASLLLAFGFVTHGALYRRYGMGLFALVMLRVLLVDTANLETPVKIVAWLGLGGALLLFGFMYAQYKDRMARWL